MRQYSPEILAALEARQIVARDFLWIVARNRDTGDPIPDGNWSDIGDITVDVINPDTNGVSTRTYHGAGDLISIDNIPLVSTLTVQNVPIRLSQVADRVNTLIRDYDCKQARVEIHRGLFDPGSRTLVAPAICRFVGFIDQIQVLTPSEGNEGGVELTCASHTQEMTRSNPDTRSDASQRLRSATDDFYADTSVVGDWQHFWGQQAGTV